jgi:uncharacterized protein (DUF1330 family)
MVAYVVLQIEITDPERHAKYREIATPLVERYGGKYLARGGKMEVIEGDSLSRIVIVNFPPLSASSPFAMRLSTKRQRRYAKEQREEICSLLRGPSGRGTAATIKLAYYHSLAGPIDRPRACTPKPEADGMRRPCCQWSRAASVGRLSADLPRPADALARTLQKKRPGRMSRLG